MSCLSNFRVIKTFLPNYFLGAGLADDGFAGCAAGFTGCAAGFTACGAGFFTCMCTPLLSFKSRSYPSNGPILV